MSSFFKHLLISLILGLLGACSSEVSQSESPIFEANSLDLVTLEVDGVVANENYVLIINGVEVVATGVDENTLQFQLPDLEPGSYPVQTTVNGQISSVDLNVNAVDASEHTPIVEAYINQVMTSASGDDVGFYNEWYSQYSSLDESDKAKADALIAGQLWVLDSINYLVDNLLVSESTPNTVAAKLLPVKSEVIDERTTIPFMERLNKITFFGLNGAKSNAKNSSIDDSSWFSTAWNFVKKVFSTALSSIRSGIKELMNHIIWPGQTKTGEQVGVFIDEKFAVDFKDTKESSPAPPSSEKFAPAPLAPKVLTWEENKVFTVVVGDIPWRKIQADDSTNSDANVAQFVRNYYELKKIAKEEYDVEFDELDTSVTYEKFDERLDLQVGLSHGDWTPVLVARRGNELDYKFVYTGVDFDLEGATPDPVMIWNVQVVYENEVLWDFQPYIQLLTPSNECIPIETTITDSYSCKRVDDAIELTFIYTVSTQDERGLRNVVSSDGIFSLDNKSFTYEFTHLYTDGSAPSHGVDDKPNEYYAHNCSSSQVDVSKYTYNAIFNRSEPGYDWWPKDGFSTNDGCGGGKEYYRQNSPTFFRLIYDIN